MKPTGPVKPIDRRASGPDTQDASGRAPCRGVLDNLVQLACRLGASQAAVFAAAQIRVEDRLAAMCRTPECEAYGLAASCPPHVGGPDEFRRLQKKFAWALFLKIDVPTEILLSEERLEVYRLLHEIVSTLQKAAVDAGCGDARAFAGGSCKKIFCADRPDCPVVDHGGSCRHPDRARPSMSGYGIDVFRLMETAGWRMDRITKSTNPATVPMGSVAGLVLVK